MRRTRIPTPHMVVAALCVAAFALGSMLGPDRAARAASSAPAAVPEAPAHEGLSVPSLVACGTCHREVWHEWSESLHHRAWTNANVRNATDDFRRVACRPCHSPMPSLGLTVDEAPDYRDHNQADGVHCLSCHGIPGDPDHVAAARTDPSAPCRPVRDDRLVAAESCGPCHQPTHQAFDEYAVSSARAEGVRCADCHMPEVRRADGTAGRSHGPHGGFSAEFVRRGLDWDCRIEGDQVLVELRNRCGHKFPGEISSRSLHVEVRFGDGEGAATLHETLRRPFKKEDRADDRLLPDEVRVLRFTAPGGRGAGPLPVEITLRFRPLPTAAMGSAHVLGTWRGEL